MDSYFVKDIINTLIYQDQNENENIYIKNDVQLWVSKHKNNLEGKIFYVLNNTNNGKFGVAKYGEFWFNNGKLHKIDGPAVLRPNGTKEWWLNGKLHRENGPAIEYSNGDKEWWINGKYYKNNTLKSSL